ncbi:MAG: MlaD family protein [Candidatus Sericytochromatia bacterium]|nr:MlaD family protein [Candidatus Sericytochromatia bacterium]
MSKHNNEVMLGAFILLAGGLLAWMSVAVGGFNLQRGLHVQARFANATGLVKDAAVTVAGVTVGHVQGLAVDHDRAVVTLFLRGDAGIRQDVKAAIRAKSLLGEKYLELVPQSKDAPLLAEGDTINDTRATVEVDELLAALGPMLREVNPRDVAAIVRGLATTVEREPDGLARIVRNAGDISQEVRDLLARNRTHLDRTAAGAAALATTLEAQRPALARTIANVDRVAGVMSAEAPALAQRAQRLAGRLEGLSAAVEPGQVRRLATRADQALARVPGLLEKADKVTERDVRALAHDVLLKAGLRVYVHPFTPPEAVQQGPLPVEAVKP